MAVLPVYLVVLEAGYKLLKYSQEIIVEKHEATVQCLHVLNQSREEIGESTKQPFNVFMF